MPTYMVRKGRLRHDGKVYEEGARVTLTPSQAQSLTTLVPCTPDKNYTVPAKVRDIAKGESLHDLPFEVVELLKVDSLRQAIASQFKLPMPELVDKKKGELLDIVIEQRGFR